MGQNINFIPLQNKDVVFAWFKDKHEAEYNKYETNEEKWNAAEKLYNSDGKNVTFEKWKAPRNPSDMMQAGDGKDGTLFHDIATKENLLETFTMVNSELEVFSAFQRNFPTREDKLSFVLAAANRNPAYLRYIGAETGTLKKDGNGVPIKGPAGYPSFDEIRDMYMGEGSVVGKNYHGKITPISEIAMQLYISEMEAYYNQKTGRTSDITPGTLGANLAGYEDDDKYFGVDGIYTEALSGQGGAFARGWGTTGLFELGIRPGAEDWIDKYTPFDGGNTMDFVRQSVNNNSASILYQSATGNFGNKYDYITDDLSTPNVNEYEAKMAESFFVPAAAQFLGLFNTSDFLLFFGTFGAGAKLGDLGGKHIIKPLAQGFGTTSSKFVQRISPLLTKMHYVQKFTVPNWMKAVGTSVTKNSTTATQTKFAQFINRNILKPVFSFESLSRTMGAFGTHGFVNGLMQSRYEQRRDTGHIDFWEALQAGAHGGLEGLADGAAIGATGNLFGRWNAAARKLAPNSKGRAFGKLMTGTAGKVTGMTGVFQGLDVMRNGMPTLKDQYGREVTDENGDPITDWGQFSRNFTQGLTFIATLEGYNYLKGKAVLKTGQKVSQWIGDKDNVNWLTMIKDMTPEMQMHIEYLADPNRTKTSKEKIGADESKASISEIIDPQRMAEVEEIIKGSILDIAENHKIKIDGIETAKEALDLYMEIIKKGIIDQNSFDLNKISEAEIEFMMMAGPLFTRVWQGYIQNLRSTPEGLEELKLVHEHKKGKELTDKEWNDELRRYDIKDNIINRMHFIATQALSHYTEEGDVPHRTEDNSPSNSASETGHTEWQNKNGKNIQGVWFDINEKRIVASPLVGSGEPVKKKNITRQVANEGKSDYLNNKNLSRDKQKKQRVLIDYEYALKIQEGESANIVPNTGSRQDPTSMQQRRDSNISDGRYGTNLIVSPDKTKLNPEQHAKAGVGAGEIAENNWEGGNTFNGQPVHSEVRRAINNRKDIIKDADKAIISDIIQSVAEKYLIPHRGQTELTPTQVKNLKNITNEITFRANQILKWLKSSGNGSSLLDLTPQLVKQYFKHRVQEKIAKDEEPYIQPAERRFLEKIFDGLMGHHGIGHDFMNRQMLFPKELKSKIIEAQGEGRLALKTFKLMEKPKIAKSIKAIVPFIKKFYTDIKALPTKFEDFKKVIKDYKKGLATELMFRYGIRDVEVSNLRFAHLFKDKATGEWAFDFSQKTTENVHPKSPSGKIASERGVVIEGARKDKGRGRLLYVPKKLAEKIIEIQEKGGYNPEDLIFGTAAGRQIIKELKDVVGDQTFVQADLRKHHTSIINFLSGLVEKAHELPEDMKLTDSEVELYKHMMGHGTSNEKYNDAIDGIKREYHWQHLEDIAIQKRTHNKVQRIFDAYIERVMKDVDVVDTATKITKKEAKKTKKKIIDNINEKGNQKKDSKITEEELTDAIRDDVINSVETGDILDKSIKEKPKTEAKAEEVDGYIKVKKTAAHDLATTPEAQQLDYVENILHPKGRADLFEEGYVWVKVPEKPITVKQYTPKDKEAPEGVKWIPAEEEAEIRKPKTDLEKAIETVKKAGVTKKDFFYEEEIQKELEKIKKAKEKQVEIEKKQAVAEEKRKEFEAEAKKKEKHFKDEDGKIVTAIPSKGFVEKIDGKWVHVPSGTVLTEITKEEYDIERVMKDGFEVGFLGMTPQNMRILGKGIKITAQTVSKYLKEAYNLSGPLIKKVWEKIKGLPWDKLKRGRAVFEGLEMLSKSITGGIGILPAAKLAFTPQQKFKIKEGATPLEIIRDIQAQDGVGLKFKNKKEKISYVEAIKNYFNELAKKNGWDSLRLENHIRNMASLAEIIFPDTFVLSARESTSDLLKLGAKINEHPEHSQKTIERLKRSQSLKKTIEYIGRQFFPDKFKEILEGFGVPDGDLKKASNKTLELIHDNLLTKKVRIENNGEYELQIRDTINEMERKGEGFFGGVRFYLDIIGGGGRGFDVIKRIGKKMGDAGKPIVELAYELLAHSITENRVLSVFSNFAYKVENIITANYALLDKRILAHIGVVKGPGQIRRGIAKIYFDRYISPFIKYAVDKKRFDDETSFATGILKSGEKLIDFELKKEAWEFLLKVYEDPNTRKDFKIQTDSKGKKLFDAEGNPVYTMEAQIIKEFNAMNKHVRKYIEGALMRGMDAKEWAWFEDSGVVKFIEDGFYYNRALSKDFLKYRNHNAVIKVQDKMVKQIAEILATDAKGGEKPSQEEIDNQMGKAKEMADRDLLRASEFDAASVIPGILVGRVPKFPEKIWVVEKGKLYEQGKFIDVYEQNHGEVMANYSRKAAQTVANIMHLPWTIRFEGKLGNFGSLHPTSGFMSELSKMNSGYASLIQSFVDARSGKGWRDIQKRWGEENYWKGLSVVNNTVGKGYLGNIVTAMWNAGYGLVNSAMAYTSYHYLRSTIEALSFENKRRAIGEHNIVGAGITSLGKLEGKRGKVPYLDAIMDWSFKNIGKFEGSEAHLRFSSVIATQLELPSLFDNLRLPKGNPLRADSERFLREKYDLSPQEIELARTFGLGGAEIDSKKIEGYLNEYIKIERYSPKEANEKMTEDLTRETIFNRRKIQNQLDFIYDKIITMSHRNIHGSTTDIEQPPIMLRNIAIGKLTSPFHFFMKIPTSITYSSLKHFKRLVWERKHWRTHGQDLFKTAMMAGTAYAASEVMMATQHYLRGKPVPLEGEDEWWKKILQGFMNMEMFGHINTVAGWFLPEADKGYGMTISSVGVEAIRDLIVKPLSQVTEHGVKVVPEEFHDVVKSWVSSYRLYYDFTNKAGNTLYMNNQKFKQINKEFEMESARAVTKEELKLKGYPEDLAGAAGVFKNVKFFNRFSEHWEENDVDLAKRTLRKTWWYGTDEQKISAIDEAFWTTYEHHLNNNLNDVEGALVAAEKHVETVLAELSPITFSMNEDAVSTKYEVFINYLLERGKKANNKDFVDDVIYEDPNGNPYLDSNGKPIKSPKHGETISGVELFVWEYETALTMHMLEENRIMDLAVESILNNHPEDMLIRELDFVPTILRSEDLFGDAYKEVVKKLDDLREKLIKVLDEKEYKQLQYNKRKKKPITTPRYEPEGSSLDYLIKHIE